MSVQGLSASQLSDAQIASNIAAFDPRSMQMSSHSTVSAIGTAPNDAIETSQIMSHSPLISEHALANFKSSATSRPSFAKGSFKNSVEQMTSGENPMHQQTTPTQEGERTEHAAERWSSGPPVRETSLAPGGKHHEFSKDGVHISVSPQLQQAARSRAPRADLRKALRGLLQGEHIAPSQAKPEFQLLSHTTAAVHNEVPSANAFEKPILKPDLANHIDFSKLGLADRMSSPKSKASFPHDLGNALAHMIRTQAVSQPNSLAMSESMEAAKSPQSLLHAGQPDAQVYRMDAGRSAPHGLIAHPLMA